MQPTDTLAAVVLFLDSLFGNAPESGYGYLWSLPDRKSHWFKVTELDKAAKAAVRLAAASKDVYCGVAMSWVKGEANQRTKSDDAGAIFGLWADVDIADDLHKKPNLPPTQEAALELVHGMGLSPSMVIHSGHGLQAWWLLKEPWVFEESEAGAAERAKAMALCQRWTVALRARARGKGWDVDATHDLARVLRVPGTTNHKGAPVPVLVLEQSEARYTVEDFEGLLPSESDLRGQREEKVKVGALVLNSLASPPYNKMAALLDNDKKFKESFERKRRDMQDQSASSYDLALANVTVRAGWTDQEVVDLLIYTRTKFGDDQKLRQDYYRGTLTKARLSMARESGLLELEEIINENEAKNEMDAEPVGDTPAAPKEPGRKKITEETKATILETLSESLEIRILKIIKFMSDPGIYVLETDKGRITLGGVNSILRNDTFRSAIAEVNKVVIPTFKPAAWAKIAQFMLLACEEQELGEGATENGACRAWLIDYFEDTAVINDKDMAASTKSPFFDGPEIGFFEAPFLQWIAVKYGIKISSKDLGKILRVFGAKPKGAQYKIGETMRCRNTWFVKKSALERQLPNHV